MAKSPLPTPENLRKLLRYEAETGKLYWLERTPENMQHVDRPVDEACRAWNSKWAGKEALTADQNGYRAGSVNCRTFRAHRVIWAIVYGAWPEGDIDHIDGDRSNNRISNLRDVTRLENARNIRKSRHNTSGVTGVYRTHTRLWSAKISVGNISRHLGYFETLQEAAAARRGAEIVLGFSASHGRRP